MKEMFVRDLGMIISKVDPTIESMEFDEKREAVWVHMIDGKDVGVEIDAESVDGIMTEVAGWMFKRRMKEKRLSTMKRLKEENERLRAVIERAGLEVE